MVQVFFGGCWKVFQFAWKFFFLSQLPDFLKKHSGPLHISGSWYRWYCQFRLYLIHYLTIYLVFKIHRINFHKDKVVQIWHIPYPLYSFISNNHECHVLALMSFTWTLTSFNSFKTFTGFRRILYVSVFVESTLCLQCSSLFSLWCCSIILLQWLHQSSWDF